MKKLVTAFVCLFCISPVLAETYLRVDADSLYTIAQQYFPDQEKLTMMLSAYNAQLDATGNQGVTATGMWQVCRAGGLDIETAPGKQQCTAFTNSLMVFADTEYYDVCDEDEYAKIPENVRSVSKCERDFFNWTNVQMAQAITLAQEYARIKWNDEIICSQDYRKKGNDDWVSCKSPKTGAFYEFKFDDVRESIDVDIQRDIANAICELHGGQPSGTWCKTDQSTCNKVNASAEKFGYNAEYITEGIPHCIVSFNTVTDRNELRTACGIDNFEFCRGLQANTNLSIIDILKQYVGNQCDVSSAMITCDSGFKTYTGPGCAVNMFKSKDDIITCYYNGQPIDFVFDDVNELSRKRAKSAEQAMMCINADGTFDGKHCVAADQTMCEKLQAQNEVSCPQCKDIYWDTTNNLCILPDSRDATRLDNATKIATVAGTVVVAVAATVFTAGTGTVAIAGSVLVTVGGAGVIASEAVMTYGIFDPFVKQAQQCFLDNDAKCAEDLIINELNRMQGYKEELTDAQQRGLDDIFLRLIEMLPDDSVFWTDFFNNPEFFDCDESGDNCAVKSPTQFWQVARTVGNVMMIAGGLLNIVSNYTQMIKIQDAIPARVSDQLNKRGLLHNVNVTGNPGTAVSNQWLRSIAGQNGWPANITNSQLVQRLGLKVGDRVWFTPAGKMLTGLSANAAQNLGATIVADVVAGGNLVFHNLEESDALIISRPDADEDTTVTPVPVPILDDDIEIPDDDLVVEDTPISIDTDTPLQVDYITPPSGQQTPGAAMETVEPIQPQAQPTATESTQVTQHTVERKNNAGLIATAAVVGAIGTGALIGVLASGDDDDDDKTNAAQQNSQLENNINFILANAAGTIGVVGGNTITLARMQTMVGSYVNIVNINGNAVVVAIYDGHYLPYFMDKTTMQWTPTLGISSIGGYINTYPATPTGISEIDQIAGLLNQKLPPAIVAQFTGTGATGVQFPAPAPNAYNTINAEFPNGVVQSAANAQTSASQNLYNNNLQRMRNLFNMAAHLGGFLFDYS